MDFALSAEQRSMIKTVRELTQDMFKPNALKYMDGTFPWENIKALAEIGVLGDVIGVPEADFLQGTDTKMIGGAAERDRCSNGMQAREEKIEPVRVF